MSDALPHPADSPPHRAPDAPARPVDVLIVGAGFAGLYMLHLARQRGLQALVVEAAGGVGGTWYHNRYPGARVDIQSLEYSFGFDDALQQDWHWTERYAAQPELLAYANHVADRYALRDGILLNTRVAAAQWDEASSCWQARAQDGRRWTARYLVLATGPLSTPNQPDFPGLQDFQGQVLHTAAWPHEPVDLAGKRVGVIGTGSSGVQTIIALAPEVAQLTVFQRTPSYAVPAHNGPLDKALEAQVKADYPAFRERNRKMMGGFGSMQPPNLFSALSVSAEEREAMFEARWQIGGFGLLGTFNDLIVNPAANELAGEFVRNKIRAMVQDPATAEALCPTHPIGCKRLCVDTGYYATFNRPNVQLVDLQQAPIERFTATGLVTGGQEHTLDAIVLATGFDAMTGTLLRLDLRGRGGQRIQDHWQAGPLNYLGLCLSGFPNLFTLTGPGATAAFTNVMVAIEHQVQWIADTVTDLDARGLRTLEATPEAETAWVAHVNTVAARTIYLGCNSWYLGANIPGKPRIFMPLFGFPAYVDTCSQVQREGYPGFVLN
jgi:cation diffusion facilitator CzcD-associated flavoprotein CzcO